MEAKLNVLVENKIFSQIAKYLHINSFVPTKGQSYLIEAFSQVQRKIPNSRLVIVGDGTLLKKLKNRAEKLGISSRVLFTGFREDVLELIRGFDVFVLPSLNEGMGKVLVEAMALGKPIIASNIGGITDLVIHEENGFLVPHADADAIARSIISLYCHPAKRKEMGGNGKRKALEYNSYSMSEMIDQLYIELLALKKLDPNV